MENILKDDRFAKLVKDPRYRQIPNAERKVKIDKRFQPMFNSESFKIKYTVDKRGKPLNQTSTEDLKKYYDLSSSEDTDDTDDETNEKDFEESDGRFVRMPIEEVVEDSDSSDSEQDNANTKNDELDRGIIPKNVKKKLKDLDTDYARGEGVLFSDSSSDEESENSQEEDIEHCWGELDADAETCDDPTYRLAVCNMDWDNIKAHDLYVLFNSFLPPGGTIKSVSIYPSEFGKQRMKEEDIKGPKELTETKLEDKFKSDDENEEGSKYHMEKLRQYQLNRLKYYYAVVIFDSVSTANKIYSDCDGLEYESSATKLDLRFIPDDTIFDEEIHDECTELPRNNNFKPRTFVTTALQQAKVQLTWDAVNPHREEILKSAADGDINNDDIRNYLACSSEEETDSDNEEVEEEKSEKPDNNADSISKYKSLLQEIEETENKKKKQNLEMEITWGLGLKEKTEKLVKDKLNKAEEMTPFEKMVKKQKEKRKAKKIQKKVSENQNDYSSDEIPSDVDMNDSYFAEEFNTDDFKQTSNKKKIKNKPEIEDPDKIKRMAELELLLDDDDNNKAHFSMKKIQEMENDTKTKKRKQKKNKKEEKGSSISDFQIDVNDERFSALFTSHHYNIDPSDPNFKKTKAMETLINEKLKRRPTEESILNVDTPNKKSKKDPAMTVLINNIKRKTGSILGK